MRKISFWGLLVLLQMSAAVWAEQTIENVTVVALSPLDKSAVVRLSGQSMQVLKPGDTINGTEWSLTQILTNKLVFEERLSAADLNGPSRVVWLHKAVNGISEVEYPAMPN
jgi:hypothetical protein